MYCFSDHEENTVLDKEEIKKIGQTYATSSSKLVTGEGLKQDQSEPG